MGIRYANEEEQSLQWNHEGWQLFVEPDSACCRTACCSIYCTNAAGEKDLRHTTISEWLYTYNPYFQLVVICMGQNFPTKLLISITCETGTFCLSSRSTIHIFARSDKSVTDEVQASLTLSYP
jgi:hypothetical protein